MHVAMRSEGFSSCAVVHLCLVRHCGPAAHRAACPLVYEADEISFAECWRWRCPAAAISALSSRGGGWHDVIIIIITVAAAAVASTTTAPALLSVHQSPVSSHQLLYTAHALTIILSYNISHIVHFFLPPYSFSQ